MTEKLPALMALSLGIAAPATAGRRQSDRADTISHRSVRSTKGHCDTMLGSHGRFFNCD